MAVEMTWPSRSQSMELTPKSDEQVTVRSLPRATIGDIPCPETVIPIKGQKTSNDNNYILVKPLF